MGGSTIPITSFCGLQSAQQGATLRLIHRTRLDPSNEQMEPEFKYPAWQKPLQEAILDRRRLLDIETFIRDRLRALVGSEFQEERQALLDALATIRVTKHES